MFYAIMTPEMVIWWAMRQWLGAGDIAKRHKDKGWKRIHGYFVQMGGFVLYQGKTALYPLSIAEMETLERAGKMEWPETTSEDIEDRSKGDYLAKGVVILQSLWFVTQCIARAVNHIMLTELELSTAGFAVLNGVMYFYWWNKPLDVRVPIRVQLLQPERTSRVHGEMITGEGDSTDEVLYTGPASPGVISPFHRDVEARLVGPYSTVPVIGDHRNWLSKATDNFSRDVHIHGILWTLWNRILYRPFAVLLGPLRDMGVQLDLDKSRHHVPTFHASGTDGHYDRFSIVAVAVVFGAIHCLAWSFHFATRGEQFIWRVASLSIASVPVAMFACVWILPFDIAEFITILLGLAYILARGALLVLAVTQLRSLPASAFDTVNWTTLIPHL